MGDCGRCGWVRFVVDGRGCGSGCGWMVAVVLWVELWYVVVYGCVTQERSIDIKMSERTKKL